MVLKYVRAATREFTNEQWFPHVVEVALPPKGFGSAYAHIQVFHAKAGIEEKHGRGRHHKKQQYVRWCFADPSNASAFQTLFGGTLIKKTDSF